METYTMRHHMGTLLAAAPSPIKKCKATLQLTLLFSSAAPPGDVMIVLRPSTRKDVM